MPRHLLLVPSLACPAGCSYCFGPRFGVWTNDAALLLRAKHVELKAEPGFNARFVDALKLE